MANEIIRDTRVNIQLKATYVLKNSECECEVLDISNNGLRIRSRQVLVAGDLLKVNLNLKGEVASFFAVVRNGKDTSYGLEFEEMHPHMREIIDNYLTRLFETTNRKPREKVEILQEIMAHLKS